MEIKIVCPSIDELSIIVNRIQCPLCDTIFKNQSQFRMHDLKVHKKQKINKNCKENIIRYHCPIENCVYSVDKKKYFKLYKYLKQHFLKVHAEKQFACTNCKKKFSTNAAKEAHEKICGTNFICTCQKIYNSYEALLTHAKRKSHKVDFKYKNSRLKNTNQQPTKLFTEKLIFILPKSTCDGTTQTDEKLNNLNNTSRQTQTCNTVKDKQTKKSAETQTKTIPRLIRVHKVEKHKKTSIDDKSVAREEINLFETLSSKSTSPDSSLSVKQDIILEDIWDQPIKNIFTFTSGTQTSPEKYLFGLCENQSTQDPMYHRLSKSDPMLTEKVYTDKFNSIETQTEEEYCRSIFDSDQLNNETQTTENFTEAMDTYTQTCDEIFSSLLSDIQTQTDDQ